MLVGAQRTRETGRGKETKLEGSPRARLHRALREGFRFYLVAKARH